MRILISRPQPPLSRPCLLTYSFHSSSSSNSFLFSFRPHKRFHFLKPCSSLKQSKKQQQTLQKSSSAPRSSGWFLNPKSNNNDDDDDDKVEGDDIGWLESDTAMKGTLLAGVLLVGVVGNGPAGYALFVAVYAGLEVLAIPAIPLTMSAGLLFGSFIGTIIVSISGTVAASVAFLIARYFARERILKLVKGNKKFLAIDKAIGGKWLQGCNPSSSESFASIFTGELLYGLTSVKFVPYVLGSWLGMLPGTWAYVSAGAFGRAIILWTLGLGLLATALAAAYVTRLAKDAVKDIE
ncbi:hypothetical protein Dsin_001638 [Dipteronia sinensis]|uniref:VTT domain-containing protein n=1 Tax=Dipteronia sinensis TaxID=43782 RepID=A0AAE0B4P6_9ROSI|nr:hypothetical protein Dsin_001638 [Dipteronia sinensis]